MDMGCGLQSDVLGDGSTEWLSPLPPTGSLAKSDPRADAARLAEGLGSTVLRSEFMAQAGDNPEITDKSCQSLPTPDTKDVSPTDTDCQFPSFGSKGAARAVLPIQQPRVSAEVGTSRKSCHFVPTSDVVFGTNHGATSRRTSRCNSGLFLDTLAQCANLVATQRAGCFPRGSTKCLLAIGTETATS
jgi:hypothetical protein